MNTAEQKGKELIEKYLGSVTQECEHDSYCDKPECYFEGASYCHCVVNIDIAKACALICVENQISLLRKLLKSQLHNDFGIMAELSELIEVKQYLLTQK